jgi:hypothetical protein
METVHLSAITRPDGTLLLTVPTAVPAGMPVDVEVRIEKKPKSFGSRAEWLAWARAIAGSITDPNFTRPEQPPLGQIEPL